MTKEIDEIKKNNTYTLLDAPAESTIVGSMWIFQTIKDSQGRIVRYKARLTAKGFAQKYGIDYDEVFAPTCGVETIRLILAVAIGRQWEIHQSDVSTAFLNSTLPEDISVFMKQPEGFAEPGKEKMVCKLNKALYGLKQASHEWNKEITSTLCEMGFEQSKVEECLLFRMDAILCVYVDDLIISGANTSVIKQIQDQLDKKYKLKHLGSINWILGIKVSRTIKGLELSYKAAIDKMLMEFGMDKANPSKHRWR